MCYSLFLSTTSSKNLTLNNTALVQFSVPPLGNPAEEYLAYKNVWSVESGSGCSCGFRHLYFESVELGFNEPEAWFPEEPEVIVATEQFISEVRALVEKGEKVDCIDLWNEGGNSPF